MSTTFPFGFPGPTALYLVLFVVTLSIHVVFMNYVLAGAGWLVVSSILRWRGRRSEEDGSEPGAARVAEVIRDWMPAALSAAITAGVAPLLFVQILYRSNFYTANLLLFHRWMSILPALIMGFYLLYLLRSAALASRRFVVFLVSAGAFACFAFTAYSWTENHLLSLAETAWVGFYEAKSRFYTVPELWPRLAVWGLGALPTLATLVGWQIRGRASHGAGLAGGEVRRLAGVALVGLLGSGLAGGGYYAVASDATRGAILGPLARPYLIAAVAGMAAQGAAWLWCLRRGSPAGWPIPLATVGCVVAILGATVTREAVRLGAIDIAARYPAHAQAREMGGAGLFLAFFVVNAVLIAWCVWLVRRAGPEGATGPGPAA